MRGLPPSRWRLGASPTGRSLLLLRARSHLLTPSMWSKGSFLEQAVHTISEQAVKADDLVGEAIATGLAADPLE